MEKLNALRLEDAKHMTVFLLTRMRRTVPSADMPPLLVVCRGMNGSMPVLHHIPRNLHHPLPR